MEMENLSNEMTLYEIDQLVVEFFYAMSRLHKLICSFILHVVDIFISIFLSSSRHYDGPSWS